jgi:hypothetical protein
MFAGPYSTASGFPGERSRRLGPTDAGNALDEGEWVLGSHGDLKRGEAVEAERSSDPLARGKSRPAIV